MTHHQSALSTLITEVLGDPDTAGDILRRMLEAAMQDAINAEAAAHIGADRYERNQERTTTRNGTRPTTVATPASELDLAIPKMRKGSFSPPCSTPVNASTKPSTR